MLTIMNALKSKERDDLIEAEDDEHMSEKDIFLEEKKMEIVKDLTNTEQIQQPEDVEMNEEDWNQTTKVQKQVIGIARDIKGKKVADVLYKYD